jgi:hypothetical protein
MLAVFLVDVGIALGLLAIAASIGGATSHLAPIGWNLGSA